MLSLRTFTLVATCVCVRDSLGVAVVKAYTISVDSVDGPATKMKVTPLLARLDREPSRAWRRLRLRLPGVTFRA